MRNEELTFFNINEFKCKCSECEGLNNISPLLVAMLNKARYLSEVPFCITSGTRCKANNAKSGGNRDSSHLKGLAVDIRAKNAYKRYRIIEALMKVGFKRIGIADGFIHCDIDNNKSQQVIWTY